MEDTNILQKKRKNSQEAKEDKFAALESKLIKKNAKKATKEALTPVEQTSFFKTDTGEGTANTDTTWTNRQKLLVMASRGVSHAERHFVNDILVLLPHAKKECKVERNFANQEIGQICTNLSAQTCLYFEHRKREFIMWALKPNDGPLAKFQIRNMHNMKETKMTGNCLRYSRPLVLFNEVFDQAPHLKVVKELFLDVFNTPKNHPKSKPFYDHVISFFCVKNVIYFRNFQILNELKEKFLTSDDVNKIKLVEIGPRFNLTLMRIFDGPGGGKTLYSNPFYISPMTVIRSNKEKFLERQLKKMETEQKLSLQTDKGENADFKWLKE